ncbi:MAG TPA: hypothetical protein VF144_16370 [Chitinophagaceae bacterium]
MFKNLFKKKEIIDHEEQLAEWERNGKRFPPPHIVKQMAIEEFRNKYHAEILVETGTYLGDMIEAQRKNFQKVYSIELSQRLFNRAKKRFKAYSHITILHGDSGIVLNELVPKLNKITLFWLDGHYSEGITAKGAKECPVREELGAIFKHSSAHIILIDDARLFNGTHDYPTIDEINDMIIRSGKNYSLQTKDDIIRLIPSTI